MTRLRVDQSDFTLGELTQVEELLGCQLSEAFNASQPKAIAALVCVAMRRTDPTFTLDQALALKMKDFDLVTPDSDAGEALGGGNGAQPLSSPAPGPSTRST
jgi:hypothetical protein